MTSPRFYLTPAQVAGERSAQAMTNLLSQIADAHGWESFGSRFIPFHDRRTEIDGLLVTRRAVFVLEAKHLQGVIEPQAPDQWIQKRPDGTTQRLRSGIGQVSNAAARLERFLAARDAELGQIQIFPVLVMMAPSCSFEKLLPFGREIITRPGDLEAALQKRDEACPRLPKEKMLKDLFRRLPSWDTVADQGTVYKGEVIDDSVPTDEGQLPVLQGTTMEIRDPGRGSLPEVILTQGRVLLKKARLLIETLRFKLPDGRQVDLPLHAGMKLAFG